MTHISLAEETYPHGLDEGIALVFKAEDNGNWKPVVDWLAHQPEHAAGLLKFLGDQRQIPPMLAPPDRTGLVVGGLVLGEEIGRGAMGVVYKAFDPVLNRYVAVKMVRSGDRLSARELARFHFEAEAVACLDHPNIVRILACGEVNGEPYLVMPLMEGGSLAARLKRLDADRYRPADEAARLLRDIAHGVHHAHERGFIHRDLKPGNILLDKDGQPHIADFGLARRTDVSQGSSEGIAGTIAYMAPEQASEGQHITTAADIYALGVILFELLTGGVPYGGDIGSILRKLTDPTVQPPSLRQLRADVPADLEAICLKCLEKRPEDRYRSAAELAEDLTRFLNGELPSARQAGFWDWLRQVSRTRPEPNPHYSWPVTVWFGLFVLLTSVAVYGIVQTDASAAWVWVANFVSGAGMCVVLWWYMLRKFRELPVTERHSLIIAVGKILVYLAVTVAYVPLWRSVSAHSALAMYPALAAASGLGLFTLGSTNWSRFFPVGAGMIALAPVLAWWPEASPLVYGATTAGVMWYWSAAKASGFAPRGSK